MKKTMKTSALAFILSLCLCGEIQAQQNAILSKAKSYLGVRYKWGGNGYSGIDCSAFIQVSYREAGIYLPRVSRQQASFWKGKQVYGYGLKRCDLLFFSAGGTRIDHVGMVYKIQYGVVYFIHSSGSQGGVVINRFEGKWKRIHVKSLRILVDAQISVPSVSLKSYSPSGSLLGMKDIRGLSPCQIKILKNAYFAKYGYRFKTYAMRTRFNNMEWYREIQKKDYGGDYIYRYILNSTEKLNVDFLKQHEGSCH
jgi:hypothetical protein